MEAVYLALYATTVAVLLAVHVYSPISPSTVVLVLLGLYIVTIIALRTDTKTKDQRSRLVYILALIGLIAAIPLIIICLPLILLLIPFILLVKWAAR